MQDFSHQEYHLLSAYYLLNYCYLILNIPDGENEDLKDSSGYVRLSEAAMVGAPGRCALLVVWGGSHWPESGPREKLPEGKSAEKGCISC